MISLARMPIYGRIGLMAGLFAGALIIAALAYIAGDRAMTRGIEQERRFATIERLALELEIDALEMRRREKDYLLRGHADYLDQYRIHAEAVFAHLDALDALSPMPAIRAASSQIRTRLPIHGEAFETVVATRTRLGTTPSNGLEGELRAAVHAMEEQFRALDDADATVLMLMMRRHEKDFMMRVDTRYVSRFEQRVIEMRGLLDTRALPELVDAELRSRLAQYDRQFHAWAETRLTLNHEIETLSAIYGEIQPQFDVITEEARSGLSVAGAAIARDRELIRDRLLYLIIGLFAATLILTWFVAKSIVRPMRMIQTIMRQLAAGKTDIVFPDEAQGGEIGRIAHSIQAYRQYLHEIEHARHAEEDARAASERRQMMQELANSFDAQIGSITQDLALRARQIDDHMNRLHNAADQTGQVADSAARSSQQSRDSASDAARAAGDLTHSINEISRQVMIADEHSRGAVSQGGETQACVSELARSVARIGSVVTLIQSIAEQTNLLALNATIEASRAGEAGRGFAIVASEVKALADQTARATEDIRDQIASVEANSVEAVNALSTMGETISRISDGATSIADAVQNQDEAAQLIAENMSLTAGGTAAASSDIAAVSSELADTRQTTAEAREAARGLTRDTDALVREVERFVNSIRAA